MRIRLEGNATTRRVKLNGEELSPIPSQQIMNHSPDGFNWGYGGSGPAQLALAIMLKLVDKEYALQTYQSFKRTHIATLPQGKNFDIEIELTFTVGFQKSDDQTK